MIERTLDAGDQRYTVTITDSGLVVLVAPERGVLTPDEAEQLAAALKAAAVAGRAALAARYADSKAL